MKLHDNAFSPFARKVRLVLELKKLPHEVVDGLALENRERLAAVNPRVEVPALEDRGVVVIGSSDIVAYLERVYPDAPVYPAAHADFVHARAWERCADTVIDPILIDVSYWMWAERPDTMPAGMLDAARKDMATVYDALERDLGDRSFLGGDRPCIADVALFPHIASTRMLGLAYDAARVPRVHGWMQRLRAHPTFAADLARVKTFLAKYAEAGAHERRKLFWRGDRIEWVLARGFHGWFMKEIAEGRVLWPGLGVPGPRAA